MIQIIGIGLLAVIVALLHRIDKLKAELKQKEIELYEERNFIL